MTVQDAFNSGKHIRFCSESEMDDFIERYGNKYYWGDIPVSSTKNEGWYRNMKNSFGKVLVKYNGNNDITGYWGDTYYSENMHCSIDYLDITHKNIDLIFWEELMA